MSGIVEIKRGLAEGNFSAQELTEDFLQKIEQAKPLNAFVEVCADKARAQAKQADRQIKNGSARMLEGIPLGIKDLFCTQDINTRAGSRILENFIPHYESTVTQKLLDQGMVMLGKLNTDEFAMGSSNETSAYGPVINPWRIRGRIQEEQEGRMQEDETPLVPGGSSGGPAASVAAELCVAALGTDTGGSVRQPAAFTGTVGLKPSYGRCSRWGIVAFASSLDQAGVITQCVEDAAILLNVIAGHDAKDATSSKQHCPDYCKALTSKRNLRVGIPKEYHSDNPQIEKLWQQGIKWFEAQGASIKDISLPHTKYALATYYIIAPAEASSNLARYDGVRYGLRTKRSSLKEMYQETRAAGFGTEVQRRILIGTYALSAGYYEAYYLKAQKVRQIIAAEFAEAFAHVDVLLTPTTQNEAFALGSKPDPLEMYLNDIFTVPASLAGLAAISVPSGLSDHGLPLGLQIIAPAFDEETLFIAAKQLEQAASFSARPKRWW